MCSLVNGGNAIENNTFVCVVYNYVNYFVIAIKIIGQQLDSTKWLNILFFNCYAAFH